jgi:hypothetical protein
MNVLQDGISVLLTYTREILFLFISILGLGYFSIRRISNNKINSNIKLLIAFSSGSVILCLLSFVLVVVSHYFPVLLQPGSYLILLFSILALLQGIVSKELLIPRRIHIGLGIGLLFFLLIVRLAFLKYIILPPYSDSPIHYQIVVEFLDPGAKTASKLSLENIFRNYYHFGFHSLSAWLSSITEIEPENAISLLGQVFLVIGPFSILSLVYAVTKDGIGALFAGLLAAIGWHMPAFAANWGKYPALSALAVLPSVIAIPILSSNRNIFKKNNLLLGSILLVGITLLHTRIIVCILLAVICFFLSYIIKLDEKLKFYKGTGYSLLFIISLWPLLQLLIDFYNKWLVLAVLIVLLPFAFQRYPRLFVGLFLFMFGIWLIWIFPKFFNNSFRPLLDRQFIGIMLYIPLSVMGGTGLSGLLKREMFAGTLRWATFIALVAGLMLSFIRDNSIYPDPCCDYFRESDQLAFEWLQQKASGNTLVLISASDSSGQFIGTDAGIWLFPLIGQPTNKLPFNLDWNSSDEVMKICQLSTKNIYIYMGGRTYSFDNTQLLQLVKERLFQLVFQAGRTEIYQVLDCPG